MGKPLNSYQHRCLGVVLAGGHASRMGRDKALLQRNETNMLDFSKSLLNKAGVDQIVVSGKDHDVTDLVCDAGPLAGIYSVIEQYHPSALLILPVDLPLMDEKALTKLKHIGEMSQKASFYNDNFLPLYLPINAFVEQFFQQAFSHLAKSTNQEKRGPSMRQLLKQIPVQEIIPENKNTLFNANTPQEWQQAKSQFLHARKFNV